MLSQLVTEAQRGISQTFTKRQSSTYLSQLFTNFHPLPSFSAPAQAFKKRSSLLRTQSRAQFRHTPSPVLPPHRSPPTRWLHTDSPSTSSESPQQETPESTSADIETDKEGKNKYQTLCMSVWGIFMAALYQMTHKRRRSEDEIKAKENR